MCGIAGFVGAGDRGDLIRMTRALAHRGPDGEGLWEEPGCPVHLGHRRLAIRDIAHGAQPMWTADQRVGIVFNGEIYNDGALRTELEAAGHVFRTTSCDTEVLIHGYEEWGAALPSHLNGMFAFAIFDRVRNRLFLACDRFAEKPLFFARNKGGFAFASELGALARHPGVDRSLSLIATQKFLAHGYTPSPLTPLAGASKLPPGGRLVYDIANGETAIDHYWRFAIEPDPALERRSEDEMAEELRGLLRQAVGRRLVSDVPLGCFLSGGLDSASVLATAAASLGDRPVRTFTLGFDRAGDETDDAARIAAHFKANHATIRLSADAMAEDLDRVLGTPGEPIGDATLMATHSLSRATRQAVTVALSGDGADELFAGYPQFAAMRSAGMVHRLVPPPLRRLMRSAAGFLPLTLGDSVLRADVTRGLAALDWREALWHPMWLAPAAPSDISQLFGQALRVEDLYSEAIALWEGSTAPTAFDRALEYHATMALPEGILVRADRGTMLASLEGRAAFLDLDLVDFARRLPRRFKFSGGIRKRVLRVAMRDILPSDVLTRRKRAFDLPLTRWLRQLPPSAWDAVRAAGLDIGLTRQRVADHVAGRADHSLFLWSCLSLARSLGGLAAPPAPEGTAANPALAVPVET